MNNVSRFTYFVNGSMVVWSHPIPRLPNPEMAQRDTLIKNYVKRAITGDLADTPLEAIGGWLMMYARLSQQGAQMWLENIATERARLVPAYEWPAVEALA